MSTAHLLTLAQIWGPYFTFIAGRRSTCAIVRNLWAPAQLPLACEWSGALPPNKRQGRLHIGWKTLHSSIVARCLRNRYRGILTGCKVCKGIRLALVSDYPATKKLRALRLDTYFSVVLTAQDDRVGVFKPWHRMGLR